MALALADQGHAPTGYLIGIANRALAQPAITHRLSRCGSRATLRRINESQILLVSNGGARTSRRLNNKNMPQLLLSWIRMTTPCGSDFDHPTNSRAPKQGRLWRDDVLACFVRCGGHRRRFDCGARSEAAPAVAYRPAADRRGPDYRVSVRHRGLRRPRQSHWRSPPVRHAVAWASREDLAAGLCLPRTGSARDSARPYHAGP